MRLPFGLRYRELVIAVPFVRPRDGPPGPFCHLPLLLLDRRLPTLLGRWLYGFAKQRATIRRTTDHFDAMSRSDGAPLLEARFAPMAGAPDLKPALGLLEQPLISAGPRGRWRCSRFDFGFERAGLGGVEAEVVVHPGLLRRSADGPDPGSIRAFRLETAWRLCRLRPADAGDLSGARPDPRTGRS